MEQVRIVRQTLINRDWNDKINKYVRGFMIESYLEDGRQNEPEVLASLLRILVWVGKILNNWFMKFMILLEIKMGIHQKAKP